MALTKTLSPDLHLRIGEYEQKFFALRRHNWKGGLSLLEKYENLTSARSDGDSLFEEYGVGCIGYGITFLKDRPFERATAYLQLLHILKEYDSNQYSLIHKGTPYYFLGFVFFQSYNFEESTFFLDAAASEDLRQKDPNSPAITYFTLEENKNAIGYFDMHVPTSFMFTTKLKECLNFGITIDDLSKSFLKKEFFENVKSRSLITALFSYLLESGNYEINIKLRSTNGGSIEPVMNHLFKGARILESLLRLKSPKKNTIEDLVENLPGLEINSKLLKVGNIKSLKSVLEIYDEFVKRGESSQNINFAVSAAIRNLTSHTLVWIDKFETIEKYGLLNQCLETAIFWSIYKLWIENKV